MRVRRDFGYSQFVGRFTALSARRISIGNWYQLPMLIPWVPKWEQRREVLRGIIYPVSPRWQRGKRALRRWLQTQVPRICTESITNGPVLICPFPSFSRPYTLIK